MVVVLETSESKSHSRYIGKAEVYSYNACRRVGS